MSEERRLGRGLDSLLSPSVAEPVERRESGITQLDPTKVKPNPFQPRETISEESIAELAGSIRTNGVLQPVVVRMGRDGYELISGERRLRATIKAGLPTVPAIVRQADDSEMLTLALVENLQRSDLNAIEKALGFKSLMERFRLTQEEVAQRVGMDRSSVANLLRLLELPLSIRQDVSRGTITMGHARALLSLSDPQLQVKLATRIKKEDLSVREIERLVAHQRLPRTERQKPAYLVDLESRLRQRLGGKVEVVERNAKGKIVIYFSDVEDLDRILEVIGA